MDLKIEVTDNGFILRAVFGGDARVYVYSFESLINLRLYISEILMNKYDREEES